MIGIMDSSRQVIARYRYDAWGKLISMTDASGAALGENTIGARNPLRYRGYIYDSETGFYYLQSRYYDPVVHRFINADGYVSTGTGFTGYNMYAYCNNDPVNMVDSEGCDPVPVWAKHIIAGNATESEYKTALSSNANAWAGSARFYVDKAIAIAKDRQNQQNNTLLYSEHKKKGTTNQSNRKRHEEGQARKQRDNRGEKGDARRHPNPNKRPNRQVTNNVAPNPSQKIPWMEEATIGERVFSGAVALGAAATVVYLIANDITGVGAADDGAIAPLIPIIWDNAAKVFS